MFRRFLGFIRGDKYLPPSDVEYEYVRTDGTTIKARPGDVIETDKGRKFGVNQKGQPYLLFDPAFKLQRARRDKEGHRYWLVDGAKRYLTDAENDELDWVSGGAALALTLLVGGIIALLVVAVL